VRHVSELKVHLLAVSDAVFVLARDFRFMPVFEILQPFWIESTAATDFAPRMPKLVIRYELQSWIPFLGIGAAIATLGVSAAPPLSPGVPDLGVRTDFISIVPDIWNIDVLVTRRPVPKAEMISGRAIIQFKTKGRDDRLGTSTLTFDSPDPTRQVVEQTFEFDRIQGGDVTVVGGWMTLSMTLVPWAVARVKAKIRGHNPKPKSTIREYMKRKAVNPFENEDYTWMLWVIAWSESRFRQFDDAKERRGLPATVDGLAFGVMGLRWWGTKPYLQKPNAQEIWDWQANVRRGIQVFQEKMREIDKHYDNLFNKNPAAYAQFKVQFPDSIKRPPGSSPGQFYRPAYYQHYKEGWDYWVYQAGKWIPNETLLPGRNPNRETYSSHGTYLMHIEDRKRRGETIPEWD
jgi:hypothetical protein